MNEMRQIYDTVQPMLKTEAYYHTKHPELETKWVLFHQAVFHQVMKSPKSPRVSSGSALGLQGTQASLPSQPTHGYPHLSCVG